MDWKVVLLLGIGLLAHCVVPVGLSIWFAYKATRTTKLQWIGAHIALWTFTIFIFIYGAGWAMLGVYTRWIVVGIVVCAGAIGAWRLKERPFVPDLKVAAIWPWIGLGVSLVVAGLFGSATAMLIAADSPGSNPATVSAPLEPGTYLIGQGGGHPAVNHHFEVKAQKRAYDILELGQFGFRADGFMPSELDAYEIYGAEVRAPCEGEVVEAKDEYADLPPPERNKEALAGNYVALHCRDMTLLLAHLKHDSVAVETGERVEVGQPIGAVGNTGNTTEPHLHIHAVEGRVTDHDTVIRGGTGVPLKFEGQPWPLSRNDVLEF